MEAVGANFRIISTFFRKANLTGKFFIKMLFMSKPTFEPGTHRTLTALVEYIPSDEMAIGE